MNNSVLVGRFFYPILNETLKIIISSVLPIPFILFINLIILTSYNVRNRLAEAITGTSLDLERKDLAKDFSLVNGLNYKAQKKLEDLIQIEIDKLHKK